MTRDEAETVLDQGRLFVVIRPQFPGVQVPPHLFSAPRVTLMFSTYFQDPVELTDDYIAQVLTFGGHPWPCHVPLAAVEHHYSSPHDFQAAPPPRAPALRLLGDDDEEA